ncbi:MAG: prolyl oligopeptidase family serine peptidase [Anaerolineaceae bacterium]|nr:prolyl oligopeptidase family serine peptidase [Anaerolineaceae bacterium]
MKQKSLQMNQQITKTVQLDYLCHIPLEAENNPDRKYPMIFFLHGAGERGMDLSLILKHGIPKEVEAAHDFLFITICPQCHENITWAEQLDELNALYQLVISTYPVDVARVYLTGMSMGGFGTLAFAAKYPQYFAAIAPICGGSPWLIAEERVEPLLELPTWVFHGAKDDVVPISFSEKIVTLLKAGGADVQFTVYPEADHDAWTETYTNPALYEWFLGCKRG